MKIIKVLNQNAVLVLDEEQEKVAVGKGVGFNKKKNDLIFHREVERLFVMEAEGQQKLQTLLSQIDEKFFFAAEEIIDYAETVLMEKLNDHLLIALSDHLSFSAENISNGILIRNKLLREIEVLYNEEFAIAQWAVEYLNNSLGIPYTYDEAGYIAIHIHSSRSGHSNNNKSIREVTIVSAIIQLIENELGVNIHSKEMLLNYSRLANHLRLLLHRFESNQYAVLDEEILDMVKGKYPESYNIAKKIRVLLMKTYQLSITGEELGYLAIHIERLRLASEHMEKGEKIMKAYMQRMGRSLMLPVATLPVAALFMGIGYWIDPSGWGGNNILAAFLIKAGATILDNLGILFAVGLALGMSKDKDGSSALAGLIAFLVPMQLLAPATVAMFTKVDVEQVNVAFSAINNKNVFIGILAGLIAAEIYNRFNNVKLPMALSFFSGKRSVPIVTAAVMLVVSAGLIFVWPPVYNALVSFGEAISGLGAVGAGLYGFFNRLLIPTGLHHALNNVFWFNIAGIDDIGKFWASEGVKGVTGMYQAGFFPVMMFGLPAGALAIYQCARPENKKATASLMMAAAFASFFTGVTEPLEFSFMFVAWPLYVVHAALTGISMFVAATFQWTAGFNFSAGFIDFILSLRVPIANKPYMLLLFGLVMAVVYYVTFMFVIKKFNLMTPGREEVSLEEVGSETIGSSDKFAALAAKLYDNLGGVANLQTVDNCTTRLRLSVNDTSRIDTDKIKATGVPGVKVIDGKNIQIIVGTEVQFVADELSKIHQAGGLTVSDSKENTIYAVATGKIIPITEVSDDVFSAKMMGDGFAILPENGDIYSPVDGVITSVFPTKHAYGIKTVHGLEVLVHVGIDTVNLKGAPFDVFVKEGDKVSKGTKLCHVDLKALEEANKQSDVIVVFTNQDKVEELSLNLQSNVKANDLIGQVKTK